MNFQKISLKNKRQTTSNTDLNQFRLDHKSCITKKRSSLFGLDHLEYENGFLFRSLSRKSFLNKRDYKIKECETLNWKMMAIASDSKSILNDFQTNEKEKKFFESALNRRKTFHPTHTAKPSEISRNRISVNLNEIVKKN